MNVRIHPSSSCLEAHATSPTCTRARNPASSVTRRRNNAFFAKGNSHPLSSPTSSPSPSPFRVSQISSVCSFLSWSYFSLWCESAGVWTLDPRAFARPRTFRVRVSSIAAVRVQFRFLKCFAAYSVSNSHIGGDFGRWVRGFRV